MPFFQIASLTEIVPIKEISGFSKDEKVWCSDCIEDTKRSNANQAAYGVINYESAEHLQEREESGGIEYVCAEHVEARRMEELGIEQVLALEPGDQVIWIVPEDDYFSDTKGGAGTLVYMDAVWDETSTDFAGKLDVMYGVELEGLEGHYESAESYQCSDPKEALRAAGYTNG